MKKKDIQYEYFVSGRFEGQLNEIEIQCLPADIPESFELDISELGMGDSLNTSDIKTTGFNLFVHSLIY